MHIVRLDVHTTIARCQKVSFNNCWSANSRVKFANAKNYGTEQLQNLAEAYDNR